MRTPANELILTDMENFSTPQRALLPWIANLATLAVVVGAIGWSGEHRPDAPTTAVSVVAPASVQTAPAANQAPAQQPDTNPGRWPAKTTPHPINSLQAVGYSPGQLP